MSTVTIIIPHRNMRHLLPGCLEAIEAQTRKPDVVRVVEDVNGEGPLAICNRELAKVTTTHVYFAAADDQIEPRFIEVLMKAAKRCPSANIVHCRSLFREVETGMSWKAGSKEQPASNAVIYRTEALRKIGGFDEDLKWHSDWMAYQRLSVVQEFVPDMLATANIRGDGYCGKGRNSVEQDAVLAFLVERAVYNGIPVRRLAIFGTPMLKSSGWAWPIGAKTYSLEVMARFHSFKVGVKNMLGRLRKFPRFAMAVIVAPFAFAFLVGVFTLGCLLAFVCKRLQLV